MVEYERIEDKWIFKTRRVRFGIIIRCLKKEGLM